MTAVIKAIGILLLQIIIYYLFGTMFELFCRKKHGVVFKEISGFLVYQVLFQICALPMIKADQTLARLAVLWGVIVITCCIGTAIFCRERIAEDIEMIIKAFFRHKVWFLLMGCFLFAMCYYVSINGEMNDDSTYYIGLINTTLTSGRLYKFNAYTGEQVHSLYLRRALVTFDINTAVACKIYHIHPLVITRITRASLNMILTEGAVYLIGRNLFQEEKDAFWKAGTFTCIALACNFLFDNTIYTSAAFLLHRAYEGKAYAGNMLLLFTIYLCILYIRQRDKWNCIYLILTLWACIAISSSAIMVTGAACGVLLIPVVFEKLIRRIKRDKNYD